VRSTRTALVLSLGAALALAACGGGDDTSTTVAAVSPTVNVGRTTDPLSQLLAEIYGQGMENSGVRVGRKDPVADLDALYAGLAAGTVQFVPETTVSILDRLGVDVPPTVDEQLTAINGALPAGQTANSISSATATQVVVCTGAAVEANSLQTVSDLAAVSADVTIAGTSSFATSPSFSLDDLNSAYETEFTFVAAGDTDADVAAAVVAGDAACGVMSSLEPAITTEGLLPLEDDKSAAPVDAIVPLMLSDAATPEAVAVITQLNTLLTTEVVRALLVKLETGDDGVDVIAKAFLASQASGQ
jgi:osmoprotectant transport system substrate-binding protein